MIQRTIDIKPAAMNAFEKESRRLLLCLEEDRLLIALIDKQNGEWNAIEDFSMAREDWNNMSDTLKVIKQQSSLINFTVPDTQLFFRTALAIPVPNTLRESNKLFVETQFGWQLPDEMLTDEVNTGMNVLVAIPHEQVTAFRHQFPRAKWNSTLALLLKQAMKIQGKTVLPQVFLTLSNSLAEIVFMRSDELLMARCFPYYTAENLLYHLLNTCKQLNISPAEVFIKVQGQLDDKSDMYTLLHQYFTQVELMTPGLQQQSAAFAKLPAHYYSHLMADV